MAASAGRADRDEDPGRGAPPAPRDVPAEAIRLSRLLKRKDFLAAARARRWAAPSFVLQARRRREGETDEAGADEARIGYTCSKKVGDAVRRNRAKRRLRAAAAAAMPTLARNGWDYVLIGRAEVTVSRPFADLVADLEKALGKVHEDRKPKAART